MVLKYNSNFTFSCEESPRSFPGNHISTFYNLPQSKHINYLPETAVSLTALEFSIQTDSSADLIAMLTHCMVILHIEELAVTFYLDIFR